MKLDNVTPAPVEHTVEREKHFRFIGTLAKKPGLTLFEITPETGEIQPAPIQKADSITADGQKMRDKLVTKPGCAYVWALNVENAARKWQKMKNSTT